MAEHVATVEWRTDGGYRKGNYSRGHSLTFDGGAEVRGSSSPKVVPTPMSDAAGVDPEEMLIASAAACHMLWFLHLARDAGYDVARYRDEAKGEVGRDGDGKTAIVRIVLRPEIDFAGDPPDMAALAGLHHRSHELCFIANSLKTKIVVES
jgi:organic hydroperoxide reductase OsmC/OhrA